MRSSFDSTAKFHLSFVLRRQLTKFEMIAELLGVVTSHALILQIHPGPNAQRLFKSALESGLRVKRQIQD